MWQTSLGQCWMARFQVNAEAGMVPCWASVAVAEKLIVSPTAQVSVEAGVTVPRTGAVLPAWICWVAVDVWPWPSLTRRPTL